MDKIQTYNKGFSDIMSASSKYRFYPSALLFILLSTLERSVTFAKCVVTFNVVLRGSIGDDTTTYMLSSALAWHVFCVTNDDCRSTLLMPGIGLLGNPCGIPRSWLPVYIFEISNKNCVWYADKDRMFMIAMALQVSSAAITILYIDKLENKSLMFETFVAIAI
ncbi:hypothetical protein PPTG_20091 [Phytophthora nicotianae INRA-310]|uniref:Uncharacterized protein n=1 Tax=Phytophthora nicotianae (strain INRA-310) TaxID=761204 RepID=W2PBS5_PHYN3|nr:hypothetical protein PPTG_20091 [Phytophthora nicotianae INRA-310]ETM97683.1 hypothetical protein PPTG_20091 [Phytophthora nicotianae INRA-310]